MTKSIITSIFSNFSNSPLYFVRSGNVGILYGLLRLPGAEGPQWSQTASSKHNTGSSTLSAYSLYFSTPTFYTSNGPVFRWNSYPLRRLHYKKKAPNLRNPTLPDELSITLL